ncbi:MAG TPA: ATP-dependent helicase, partial [Balneolaceae bacterium]|nr:ATP-dependent helicase [Balneolaceae bacterium]
EKLLQKKGIKAGSIHGDRDQDERNKALHEFKSGKYPVIVATDVLARGIDIDNISLIVNFDVPRQVEDYVHRIGRTGRYDKTGIAITFVNKKDKRAFSAIQDKVGDQLEILTDPGDKSNSKTKSKPVRKKAPQKKEEDSNKQASKKPSPKKAESKKPEKKEAEVLTDKDIAKANKIVENLESVDVILKGSQKKSTQKKDDKSSSSKSSKKTSPKKSERNSNNNGRQEPAIPAERITKATKRNQNSLKPAKGFWGLIKALFS